MFTVISMFLISLKVSKQKSFIKFQFLRLVATGIIAMVHDNTELPRIDVSGMELAPGFRHRLTYRRRMNILQPSPYSNCTNDIPLSLQAMFHHYQDADFAYSEGICITTCTQAHK